MKERVFVDKLKKHVRLKRGHQEKGVFFPWGDCLDTVMIRNKTLFYIVFAAYVVIVV